MQITNVLEYLENTVKRVPDKTAYANENMEMTFGEVYHIAELSEVIWQKIIIIKNR